jgi:hypothetical protein
MSGLHLVPVPTPGDSPIPFVPPDLAREIEAVMDHRYPGAGPDDPGLIVRGEEPVWHPAAERTAEAFADALLPAPREVIQSWLVRATAGIFIRPEDDARVAGWMSAIFDCCGKMPGTVWCAETRHEAQAKWRGLPCLPDLIALLQPHADALQRKHGVLERIRDAPRDRQPRGPIRARPFNVAEHIGGPLLPPEPSYASNTDRKPAQLMTARMLSGEMEYRSWFPRPDTP